MSLKECKVCWEWVDVMVPYKKEKMCEACRDHFEQDDFLLHKGDA